MKKLLIGAAVAIGTMALTVEFIEAQVVQTTCGSLSGMTDTLKERFHEKQAGFFVDAVGDVMLLYVGEEGAWTLLVVKEDVACVASAGSDFYYVRPNFNTPDPEM